MSRTTALRIVCFSIVGVGLAVVARQKFDGIAFLFAFVAIASFMLYVHSTSASISEQIREANAEIDKSRRIQKELDKEDQHDIA